MAAGYIESKAVFIIITRWFIITLSILIEESQVFERLRVIGLVSVFVPGWRKNIVELKIF